MDIVEQPDAPLSGQIAPGVFVAPGGLRIQYSRSSGPGGQNVNKINSKAELWVRVGWITGLTQRALARLRNLAASRLTSDDQIHLRAETERSQQANREEVLARLREMVLQARIEPKTRRKTKPSRSSREKRLDSKRRRSQIKSNRGRARSNDD